MLHSTASFRVGFVTQEEEAAPNLFPLSTSTSSTSLGSILAPLAATACALSAGDSFPLSLLLPPSDANPLAL